MRDDDPEVRSLAAAALSLDPQKGPNMAKTAETKAEQNRIKAISFDSIELFKALARSRMEDQAKAVISDDDLTYESQVRLTFDNGDKIIASVEEIEMHSSNVNEFMSFTANAVANRIRR